MILAMADLETPLLKKSWMSASLPSSFDFPNEPLGLPIIIESGLFPDQDLTMQIKKEVDFIISNLK